MPENLNLKTRNLKVPFLVGPTGVGKSEVAFRLAKRLKAEILSADAFQVFKGLEVGTAQPNREWQKTVPHHLVGVKRPGEPWNAVEFAREALKILDQAKSGGKRVIVVGGSGFYIRALVEGAPSGKAPNPEIREQVLERVRELGNEKAHAWLKDRDPEAAKRFHPNDLRRICRALEKIFEPAAPEIPYEPLGSSGALFLGLERSREKLDMALQERAQSMWKNGLLAEAEHLRELGLPSDHPLWGTIGYAEAATFQKGEMTEPEALERIFRRTRQYAKRQWTWFKHQHEVQWINLDEFGDLNLVVDEIEKRIV